jgi:hypothetical protein
MQSTQVDIEEIKEVYRSLTKQEQITAELISNVSFIFVTARSEALQKIAKAKEVLHAQKAIIIEACLFCRVSPQEVSDHDRAQLIEKYDDVRYEGFHCKNAKHVKLVHQLVGRRDWSCCRAPFH